ncbi:hypothetical protein [Micromonospora sp. DPT]|uniref:hypothetical protein n=1 Tax=Micromonospora sp. DPT TaxID=3142975 RepID=UPI00320B8594
MLAMEVTAITMFAGITFSNGIIVLAVVAGAVIWLFDGSVTRLIQLHILGVFTSFTLRQAGMVRHWNRALAAERDPAARRRSHRSRVINALGGLLTGLVLVIVLATKFTHGAYLVVIAVPVLYGLMRAIRRHYDRYLPGGRRRVRHRRAGRQHRHLHRPVTAQTTPGAGHELFGELAIVTTEGAVIDRGAVAIGAVN